MTQVYTRSEIYSFYELPEVFQSSIVDDYEGIIDQLFVVDPRDKNSFLSLDNFMINDNSKFTHGVFGQSYFSCYTITLSRSNDCAVVAYKTF